MPALHCYYPAFNYNVSGRGAEKHWFLMSNEGDRAHEMLRAFSQNTRGGMENICIQCVPPWKNARKYERAHYCTYTSVKTMDPFTPRLTCVFGDWITIGLCWNSWKDALWSNHWKQIWWWSRLDCDQMRFRYSHLAKQVIYIEIMLQIIIYVALTNVQAFYFNSALAKSNRHCVLAICSPDLINNIQLFIWLFHWITFRISFLSPKKHFLPFYSVY